MRGSDVPRMRAGARHAHSRRTGVARAVDGRHQGAETMIRWIRSWDFFGWIFAVLAVSFAVSQCGEAVDWLDRRSCRTSGGSVVESEHHEWRCVTAPTAERAP